MTAHQAEQNWAANLPKLATSQFYSVEELLLEEIELLALPPDWEDLRSAAEAVKRWP